MQASECPQIQGPSTRDAPSCEHKSDGAEEESVVEQLRQSALAQEVKPGDVIESGATKGSLHGVQMPRENRGLMRVDEVAVANEAKLEEGQAVFDGAKVHWKRCRAGVSSELLVPREGLLSRVHVHLRIIRPGNGPLQL
jgi:hypothetical protein